MAKLTLVVPIFNESHWWQDAYWKELLSLDNALQEPFVTRWFFDLEIILKWQRENNSGVNIWEEPLETWKEISGSHLSVFNAFSILGKSIKSLSRAVGNEKVWVGA